MANAGKTSSSATILLDEIKSRLSGILDYTPAHSTEKRIYKQHSVPASPEVIFSTNDEYKGKLSPLEFGERTKRVMAALPPRPEQLGDEYTRERRGAGPGLWMYTDDQIIKAAGIAIR